ncbi:RDD family protein [Nonlabens ponticola]|uniref:RDD family protein n=1 Tax=Nonlabens ponticola TaxID=2496866 RepID=A0A3S9MXJ3_9FLAO|nr:RDD family protein [Nonlabens ponticola]AZQ43975.1 RDD family protein [Nonlabens ponticola]
MSNTAVNTAQNVNINYTVASLGYRILAFLIDLVVLGVYVSALAYVFSNLENALDRFTSIGLYQLLFLPIAFYSLIFNIIFNGKTVGKFVLQLRTVKVDGSPATWSDYFITWIMRLVDLWLTGPGVAIISIIFTDKNQRLGGIASNTIVIDTRKKTKISHTILEQVREDYKPTFITAHQLTDPTINEAKEIYRLAGQSRDYAALKLLRLRLEELLGIKSELRDGEFVRTLLKDYTYLTQGN